MYVRRRRKIKLYVMVFLITFIICIAIGITIPFISPPKQEQQEYPKVKRALIIDTVILPPQRVANFSLIEFIRKALEKANYTVDVFIGYNVTIDVFKNLYKYQVIIMRTHSATISKTIKEACGFQKLVVGTPVIMTGEVYDLTKYVREQLAEELVPFRVLGNQVILGPENFFAITPYFILNEIPGKFSNSIVIVAGCNSSYTDILAKAFFKKGVKYYIGWNGNVLVSHMDNALYYLIKLRFIDKVDIEKAVKIVNEIVGLDPKYKSKIVLLKA